MSDWIAIQRKTFTRWANQYLKRRGGEIEDLSSDLKDGLKLAALLEIISGESVGRLNKRPKIEIQFLENLNASLKFLKDHDLKLVNIGSKDIYNSNEKLILGLLWTIILRFEVNDADGKAGLLLWVQRSTKGYKDVDVQNFTNSWNDGLAFCALINKYRPDLLDFDGLSKDNAMENLEKAFTVAEEDLGIARFLDAEDIAGNAKPDEKSIIAYVFQFFRLFMSAAKNVALIKSIKTAVEITRKHDAWMAEYSEAAPQVMEWIANNTASLKSANTDSSTAAVKASIDSFKSWVEHDKPAQASKKGAVEGVYTTLTTSKKNNERPAFVPADNISPESLQSDWNDLGEAQKYHERMLLDRYVRFQKVDHGVNKFTNKSANIKDFCNENRSKFEHDTPGDSVTEVESQLEAHERYEARLAQYKPVLETLRALSKEITKESEHEDAPGIAQKMSELDMMVSALEKFGDEHKSELSAALDRQRALLAACKAFDKAVDEFDFDIDQLSEQVNEPAAGPSLAEMESMLSTTIPGLQSEIAALAEKCSALTSTANELAETGKRPDAPANVQELVERCSKLRSDADNSVAMWEKMLDSEKQKDALCMQFADAAKVLASHCDAEKTALDNATKSGSAEEQLAAVKAISEKHNSGEGPCASLLGMGEDSLASLQSACDDAGIVVNPYTPHTIYTLTATWEELGKALKNTEDDLAAQILATKAVEVPAERLREIQEVFAFFDQDKDNKLNLQELREGCRGVGIDLEDDEVERRMRAKVGDVMEFNLDQFVEFMLEEIKTGASKDDVIRAFTILSGGEKISNECINSVFKEKWLVDYLLENIVDGDYNAFTDDVFSR